LALLSRGNGTWVIPPAYSTAPRRPAPPLAAARAILEKQLRENPDNALTWTFLGGVKAALGEKQEAIEAGQRACELWPLSRERAGALELSDISR
jgi:cytochrome c-type biogenesis protein CcmH/NrfG